MDLMNTLRLLLFCTSVLSGSRGCDSAHNANYGNQPVKVNKSLMLETKSLNRKQVLLNVHRDYPVRNGMKKNVFQDSHCFKCIDCMNRAVVASGGSQLDYSRRNRQTDRTTHNQGQDKYNKKYYMKRHNDIDRHKRSATDGATKEIEQGRAFLATVKKYTKNKKVYAIEVKTTTTSENDPGDTCHYYSVKKTLGCDEEHTRRIPRSKRTNKKTSKKMKKYSATTTESVRTLSVKNDYKKRRDIESSHGPESYMLSMEDFY